MFLFAARAVFWIGLFIVLMPSLLDLQNRGPFLPSPTPKPQVQTQPEIIVAQEASTSHKIIKLCLEHPTLCQAGLEAGEALFKQAENTALSLRGYINTNSLRGYLE